MPDVDCGNSSESVIRVIDENQVSSQSILSSSSLTSFALIRNIDLLTTSTLDLILTTSFPSSFNLIYLVDPKVFSLPSSYLTQTDVQEQILRKAITDDIIGAQDRYLLNDFAKSNSNKN